LLLRVHFKTTWTGITYSTVTTHFYTGFHIRLDIRKFELTKALFGGTTAILKYAFVMGEDGVGIDVYLISMETSVIFL
jgi:hypothetical protein